MIQLMGYNAKRAQIMGDKVHPISKTIVAATGGWHSHTEIRRVWTIPHTGNSLDVSFSAEFKVGARFKNITYSHDYRWDCITLPYSLLIEDAAWDAANIINGMEYDNLGVLGLATDFDILRPDPDKIWCSKSNARIMFAVDPAFKVWMETFGFDENISPNDLMLMAMHYYSDTGKSR